MTNVLRSNLIRIRKSPFFWVGIGMVLVNFIVVLVYVVDGAVRDSDSLLSLVFMSDLVSTFAYVGGLMVIHSCLFIGKEHEEQTIKLKIICGNSRGAIYFANITTSIVVGMIYLVLHYFLLFAVILPVAGALIPTPSIEHISKELLLSVFAITAYASIYNVLAMSINNRLATMSIAMFSILLFTLAGMGLCALLIAPEFIQYITGIGAPPASPNARYLEPAMRIFVTILLHSSPSAMLLAHTPFTDSITWNSSPEFDINYWSMYLAMFVIIVVFCAIGYRIFRKKNFN